MSRINKLEGSFAGTGQSDTFSMRGQFNLSLTGFGTATVQVERSFDGSTWLVVDSFTADAQKVVTEPESGVKWRLNCTSHTTGTINYRLSGII